MGKPEELKCPRKYTECHPLDLVTSGGAFTCCGAQCVPHAFFPYRVCMVTAKTEPSLMWNFSETQLLNIVSVVTRALAAVRE